MVAGDLVFVSGCPPWDPHTNALNRGSFDEQTKQCLANLRAIVEKAGSVPERIVKVTVSCLRLRMHAGRILTLMRQIYLQNIQDFDRMNVLYEEFLYAAVES
jgi:hypothetical protein